ncbi:EAL domain-containing protein [Methylomonas sp. SURF-2]|uniref:EAL domain-containing protein n=1 Tax=Methylomonas subterranea TaxID=2952225 RepID=A0ABT1TFK7_9GAMM|nr:EAL domain-containing protein [Methylomonas sp. SURF-2]MCQ8104243.1 EAL domain-containing protein [Methylomonas sp. SURF-2]
MNKITRQLLLAWTLLSLGLLTTVYGSWWAKQAIDADVLRQFAFACDHVTLKIRERLGAYAMTLRSGAALFDASTLVTRQDWKIFTEALRAQDSIPGVQGIGFAEAIAPERLAGHIARVRGEGFPEYRVHPAGERAFYSAIVYLEPFRDRNLRAFGYDMFSEPVRRSAMEQARDSGQAALSGKVRLIQETDKEVQPGTLMYVPVYSQDLPRNNVAQRRQALVGWVYSPYRMNDLMSGILGDWRQRGDQVIGLRIHDGGVDSPDTLLFASQQTAAEDATWLQQRRLINFNGRPWLLVFDRFGGPFHISHAPAWAILLGGIALSGLLFNLMRARIFSQITATRMADDLTREIRHREQLLKDSEYRWHTALEGLGDGVWDWNMAENRVFFSRRWKEMLGFAEDEIQDSFIEWESRIHPDDKTDILAAVRAYLEGASPSYAEEHRLLHKDGGWRWILTRGVVVARDDNGRPLRMIGTHLDITERKRMEQSLSFRQFSLDHAGEELFWLDRNARILDANKTACQKLGYSHQELCQLTIADLDPYYPMERWPEHWRELKLNKSLRFESAHKRSDGTIIPVEIVANYFEYDGKEFNCALAHDISERKQAEETLKALQSRLQFLLESTPAIIYARRASGSFDTTFISENIIAQLGYRPEDFIGESGFWLNRIHPEDRARVLAELPQAFHGGPHKQEYRFLHKDGEYRWMHDELVLIRDSEGKPLELVGYWSDISDRKKAEDELRIAAATFETHEAIMITDAMANILRVNQAFEHITGFSAAEVIGRNPRILSSGRHDKSFYQAMWAQLLTAGTWEGEIWDRRKNGQIYPKWLTITALKDIRNQPTEYVAIFTDITERKQAEEEIRHLAFYDPLTKLPNRRLLLDRLHLALLASERSRQYGALLFLDMDKFKSLNDTLGHNIGDLMLIEVAERIKTSIREVDTVARFGGDEFVVLFENIGDAAEEASQRVSLIAEKIRACLTLPFHFQPHIHISSPSIGVCLFQGHALAADDVIKQADIAMYHAKNSGRNRVHFFDPALQHTVEWRAAMESDLRKALAQRQLQLYYQIQYDNRDRPFGAEALLRWTHPERGMISPAQFIPIAEETGLILDIGLWVVETACRQLEAWRNSERTRNLILAINVSAHQFMMPDFVESIANIVRTHAIVPESLKLELTESVILHDIDDVVNKMLALRALGVRLSLDDFGTGYSSLSYLKRLPIDQVKIDQSFVRDIATDANDAMMVKNIIDIALNFQLNVIAEGVETEQQFQFLKQNGCMAYQGYFFGKPLPIDEFEAQLLSQSPLTLQT